MRFVMITGMSGAGKSLVVRQMEDLGFFCIDNMPPLLMPKFFELIDKGEAKTDQVALVVDIRGGELFNHLGKALRDIKRQGFLVEILFLEASDDALIKRFKETRRSHPLSKTATILKGISQERAILEEIKHTASYVIDTTGLSPKKLQEEIKMIFGDKDGKERLAVTILSFGFKYGIPRDSDLVFDVRFIPNPFYMEALTSLSGKDKLVEDFVLGALETIEFIKQVEEMLNYLIPFYMREGKSQLIISIGCTGGRHRSVAIAERICKGLKKKRSTISVEHRDIENDNRGIYS
jgi:RNase adapter protein RapZ